MNPFRLSLALGLILASSTALAADPAEQSLFNGRNLDGWEGDPSIWSVQDGAITGRTTDQTNLKHNTFLVWKGGTVSDFELRLKYRIVNGNSGIQYRSKVHEQGAQGPIVGGYQADFEAGKTYSGILYEERGRGILAERGQLTRITTGADGKHKVQVLGSLGKTEDIQAGIRSEDWNDYLIIARGNHLTHVINGRVTAVVIDDDPARAATTGVLALQVHVGPPMVIQARDIRLTPLTSKAGAHATGPAADLSRISGTWTVVKGFRSGEEIPDVSSVQLKITDQAKYDISWDNGGDTGSLKLHPDGRSIDVLSDSSGTIGGIYRFEGDNLRIVTATDGAPRPTSFDPPANASALNMLYRRK